MAITRTVILPTNRRAPKHSFICDVTATADADTTLAIAHGLPTTPQEVVLTPLLPSATISAWTISAIDAVNVTLLKTTGAGSGNASPQVRLIAKTRHTLTA